MKSLALPIVLTHGRCRRDAESAHACESAGDLFGYPRGEELVIRRAEIREWQHGDADDISGVQDAPGSGCRRSLPRR
jgi:hypothetical protein